MNRIAINLSILICCFRHASPDDCPAPLPCHCQSIVIFCDHLGLTEIPQFSKPFNNDSLWDVQLHHNNISRIQKGAFRILKLRKLFLSNNILEALDDDSFTGSESTISSLDFSNNKFTNIPFAVSKLQKLTELDIHQNPFLFLRKDVIQDISSTLTAFKFGNKEIRRWPSCLQSLHRLNSISLLDLNITKLPDDVFNNFPNLTFLEIVATNTDAIPSSLGNLSKIEIINLYDNPMLTNRSLIPDSFNKLSNLTTFSIMNSSITVMPNIFAGLVNLRLLDVENNPISWFPEDVFPMNFSQTFFYLTLKNTKLTSIPKTLSNLTSITNLNIETSLIQKVNDYDLQNLKKLKRLFITDSPLHEVSENAFMDLKSLRSLFLDNTYLTTIPKAVMNLPSLMGLGLDNTLIVCACENLGWIKTWARRSNVTILGRCRNIAMTIDKYIVKEIPKCD